MRPVSDGAKLSMHRAADAVAVRSPLPAHSWVESGFFEPRWYVACTVARHEKRVAEQLQGKGLLFSLPLYEAVHRWKDRRALVQLPLFPGYVFVHLALSDRLNVLTIPSVLRFVSFNGRPAPLPDGEIEALHAALESRLRAEPHPYLKVGQRVRIKTGPMVGTEGILVRKRNRYRLVLSVDLIMRSVALDVDASEVEPVARTRA